MIPAQRNGFVLSSVLSADFRVLCVLWRLQRVVFTPDGYMSEEADSSPDGNLDSQPLPSANDAAPECGTMADGCGGTLSVWHLQFAARTEEERG